MDQHRPSMRVTNLAGVVLHRHPRSQLPSPRLSLIDRKKKGFVED